MLRREFCGSFGRVEVVAEPNRNRNPNPNPNLTLILTLTLTLVATRKRGGTVSAIEGGASIKQEKRTVAVRRGENGLGIDVSYP